MEIIKLIKKPVVIVNLLMVICFALLPYFSMNLGPWGSVSKTGLGLFWTVFDRFNYLNLMLLIIPFSSGYIIFSVWQDEKSKIIIFKLLTLLVLLYLFLNIAFFAEKSSIDYVGMGLWFSLFIGVVQLFETPIMSMFNKQLPKEEKAEE